MNVSGGDELFDKLVGQHPLNQYIITGHASTGCNDTAFLIAQRWQNQLPDERIIFTNVPDVSGTIYVDSRKDIKEIVDNTDKQYMIVLDDYNYDNLFELITYLRKQNIGYVVTQSGYLDLHEWINALCDFVYKENKKTAKIYENQDMSGEICEITDLDYVDVYNNCVKHGGKL